jgi:hypothetical protein
LFSPPNVDLHDAKIVIADECEQRFTNELVGDAQGTSGVVRQNSIGIAVRIDGDELGEPRTSLLAQALPSPSVLEHLHVMAAIFLCLLGALGSAFRRRGDLILENLALRQQLAIFKHRRPNLRLTHPDRLFWVTLSRLWSRWREVLLVVKPETVGLAPMGLSSILDVAVSSSSARPSAHRRRGA